jgi:hypothetical protein
MSEKATKVGHILAKGLGIKVQKSEPYEDDVTRGESVFSVQSADTFVEEVPTTTEFLREIVPGPRQLADYAWSLFPFLHWITHYNLLWLLGDVVAGKLTSYNTLIFFDDWLIQKKKSQVSQSVRLSCLRAWHTRSLRTCRRSLVFTRLSWAS